MSWDLFSSAEAAAAPAASESGNAASPVVPREAKPSRGIRTSRAEPARARTEAVLRAPAEDLTVSALNAAAREIVEGAFPPLWVVGEVANFTRARSGHCYFTLRDENAQVRCVMWRDEARRLPTTPTEGMEVRILGRPTFYEARGEFQLTVSSLEGKGDGLWKLALERLRAKLDAEGLTSPHRKRQLPRCPRAVGVVTSPSGAVFHDILNVVRRRAPWTEVVLCGCRVQGDGAAREIADAIRLFGRAGCVDVLIVGRGGGSVEDLWAFNEEIVARAIAESPIPVISAVGHETDVTIADLVADRRAPTPSAAAEAAVPDRAALAREITGAGARMTGAMLARVADTRRAAADAARLMTRAAERLVTRRRDRVHATAQRLHALSPLSAFARGYAVALDADGRVLRRTADLHPGRRFDLRVQDGVVPCSVEEQS